MSALAEPAGAMRTTERARDTDAATETEHLRRRVALYFGVLLIIDACAYVSDAVEPLLIDDLVQPSLPPTVRLLRWLITALVASGWAFARLGRPGRGLLMALESAVTFALALAYVQIGLAYRTGALPWFGAVFALFGVLLLLVVRASLVPSSPGRTLALGVASVTAFFWRASEPLGQFEPIVLDGLAFLSGAFIIAIGVTSRVIYGLRAEIREALQLGQYTLEERLGRGGMGEVYRARHSRLRRPTAVKLLSSSMSSARAVARYEAEVQHTAELTHPNTIRIFDYGQTDDGIFYYAMELLRGATLATIVDIDGPQPVARTIKILEEAAGALQEAHASGLIHRDIKPQNLMLTRQGLDPDAVKVLDFGLVRCVDGGEVAAETAAGALVGTPLYMAPELIAGTSAGPQSDLYALGAVGYFLVTGTHVFPGATIVETCAHHLHTAPVPPSERLGARIAPDFEAIILRCLAKHPAERPASAARLITALRQCQDHGAWSHEAAAAWWQRRAGDLARSAPGASDPISRRLLTIATSASR